MESRGRNRRVRSEAGDDVDAFVNLRAPRWVGSVVSTCFFSSRLVAPWPSGVRVQSGSAVFGTV